MAQIENIVTSGTFSLDGETHNVDNNVYIVGDEQNVLVIDPAHDVEKVREAIGGRNVSAILLTHGHDDHISEVIKLRELVDAPVLIHKDDQMLWDATHPDEKPDGHINDGDTFTIAGVTLTALHTPGHS
ncbi:MAG: MBL fold metallo-hydrolase, partial [Yaniella sp.]|nr:MBL fold metallo-hydrolase [Yaniella sp.]